MKITLLHPSRGRALKAWTTAKYWLDHAGIPVEYILSLDESDNTTDFYMRLFRGIGSSRLINTNFKNERCLISSNHSVVEATNKAAKESTGEILVYLSDDFKCPDNWGELILKEFNGITKPTLLKVDDCLQKFHVPVLTIPIMNRQLYDKLGYFWHPSYKSMFVDQDLYETVKKIGALKLAEHLKFPHEHYCNGKAENDETYIRSSANWNQGKAMFAKRRLERFKV